MTEAPEGEIASFMTVWYDDVTRCGYLEPVGTVPVHQRKGLVKAVIYEGLRRLKQLGGIYGFVCGYSHAAKRVYSGITGPAYDALAPWLNRDL